MMRNYRTETLFPHEGDIEETLTRGMPVGFGEYLIDGRLRTWEGAYQEVHSPVCVRTDSGIARKEIGKYPLMTEKEALEALISARAAFGDGRGAWPAMAPGERIERVEAFVSRMIPKREAVARLLMWEIGKSYEDALKEFDRTVNYARDTAEVVRALKGGPSELVVQHGVAGRIGRVPLGVVLCMGPFNYPLFETFTALVPALLAGNTVVFKTPRFGTLLYQPLLEIFRDLFPPGVVNGISGDGRRLIPPLLLSGMVDCLAFIGTSKVATYLRGLHPKPHRLRCILGLEAKNPAIVLPDADLGMAVKEGVAGALAFNGQRCAALKVFFVHTSVVRPFLEGFSKAMAELTCGMPWEKNVSVTPLAEPGKPKYLAGLVTDAVERGAAVVNEAGGTIKGSFFYPALLYPVTPDMRIFREEQFGPVIPIVSYDDLDEPIGAITESDYGQQASIFGRDPDGVARLVDSLIHQVSRVNINCQCQRSPDKAPFAGRKDSGEGSLSVLDGVTAFTAPSFVSAEDTAANREMVKNLVRGQEG
jgi:glyceraldehyde-3-phosphate dehydrogenase (NADP+)